MTRPYSEDIRERALARADAGETVRSIAEALQISASCVTKWKNLRRDTGGLSPGQIGGDLPLNFHPAAVRVLRFCTPSGADGATDDRRSWSGLRSRSSVAVRWAA